MTQLSKLASRVGMQLGLGEYPEPPKPGLFQYYLNDSGGKSHIHLRVEPDGQAVLLINASRVFRLNPTAAFMAFLYLEENDLQTSIHAIRRQFNVSISRARNDFHEFRARFIELIHPEGPCPVCEMELDTQAPFSDRPSAPYRMDLAITYLCNNDCSHCYNAMPRQRAELQTSQWCEILDRLWNIGIPHVVFTGGEPTLRKDLPELISYASQLGMITGLNTNGRRLADRRFLDVLVASGLDHVQITLESANPQIHDSMVCRQGAWEQTSAGIRNALASPLYVMTNTTLLQNNASPGSLSETLDYLAALGVPTVGLNALIYSGKGAVAGSGLPESALVPLLELARTKTTRSGQRLVWYTPTRYCHFDPIQLQLGVKGCTAALYNMCVEPDGNVIPCQSYYQSVGNILSDPWEHIWNHSLSRSLRERTDAPDSCKGCAFLQECGGGCPLARRDDASQIPQPIDPLQLVLSEKAQ